ncbi:hypothetical protein [Paenibacillus caui]|uniref:hypothetical protein n=1 Tax=Paenibacillus caui TaxID=2873927 RepID=UPI001CAA1094|nr:hypothetical protein [Paenibacillus caui]
MRVPRMRCPSPGIFYHLDIGGFQARKKRESYPEKPGFSESHLSEMTSNVNLDILSAASKCFTYRLKRAIGSRIEQCDPA